MCNAGLADFGGLADRLGRAYVGVFPIGRGSEVGDDVGDVELCVEIGDPGHVDAPRNRVVIGELAAEDCIGEPGELGGRWPQPCRPAAGEVN